MKRRRRQPEPKRSQEQLALELARRHRLLRAATALEHGVAATTLSRLVARGGLIRVSRGLYSLPDAEPTEHRTFAEVARRAPAGVVCLLSALRFHGLSTQAPHEVWLAIRRGAHRPRLRDLPVRLVEMSADAFTHGVDVHQLEGVDVRVTSTAKTVADCFRFRSSVGLDVALEALRAFVRQRAGTMDALHAAAKVDRVAKVMLPYLEAIA